MNIYIVDDDKILRQGIKAIIERNRPEYKIIGEASNGKKALKDLQALMELKPLLQNRREM